MDIDVAELQTITDKLENYAAQVSELNTRMELEIIISGLKNDLNRTRTELEEAKAECEELKVKYQDEMNRREELVQKITVAAVENAWLRNCILLSLSSIRKFMLSIKRIELKSLFFTFLHKTILPDMGTRGLQAIDDTIDLSDMVEMEKLADQIIMGNNGLVSYQSYE
jgi:chromosome segregation ATPase